MKNEIEQIAQQNDMSVEFVTWFFNEKKSACGEHWFLMLGAMWEGWKGRSIEMDKLAAENVALKAEQIRIFNSGYLRGHESTVEGYYVDIHQDDITTYHEDVVAEISEEQTPATDRIVAGIKVDAANQMCVAFVKHKELVGLSDDDVVTVRQATDVVLHCAAVISEGAK